MEQAQVPIVRFHDLRHCSATMLVAANVNPKIIQRRLGHTSIKTTMDVYSSYLPGMQIDAARALSAALVPPAITASAEKPPVPRNESPPKASYGGLLPGCPSWTRTNDPLINSQPVSGHNPFLYRGSSDLYCLTLLPKRCVFDWQGPRTTRHKAQGHY